MAQLSQRIAHFNLRRQVNRRFLGRLCDRLFTCLTGKAGRYRVLLPYSKVPSPTPLVAAAADSDPGPEIVTTVDVQWDRRVDSDLVSLKISLLGDQEIGKTSFLVSCLWEIIPTNTCISVCVYIYI